MTANKEIIYVCTNVDCRSRGSLATIEQLKARLAAAGLLDLTIEPIVCFSACNVGPNLVLPSKRCWLSGVTQDKVDTVIQYLMGHADISELQVGNDPVLDQMIFEMIDAGLLEKADPV